MIGSKLLLVFLLLATLTSTSFGTIGGYLCPYYSKKFLETAAKGLKSDTNDLSVIYHSANTYKLLKELIPKDLQSTSCNRLKKLYKAEANVDEIFFGLSALVILQCNEKLHNDDLTKNLHKVLENEKSSLSEIRYAAEILFLFNQKIPNQAKVAQLVQAQLKIDDSLTNLGQALHISWLLGNSGKFVNDRVEDIIVQADEVDGKLLQWEGGLTTTSLLLTGLHKLPGVIPLTQEQADKFANYLLTRKTVQTPRGISALLEAANALANSKTSPVSVSISGPAQVSVDKPDLKIQVSNLFGVALKPALTPVVAHSATRITDDVVVLAKQVLTAGIKATEFILPLKVEPGHYKIVINAGVHTATVKARVLGSVEVKNFEIGLSDSDGSLAPKMAKLNYPNKLAAKLQGDAGQQLQIKFGLSRPVHQAFVRLSSLNKEVIFVAEQDTSKLYKVEINLGQELSGSGLYDIEFIIGDSIISNPFRWNVGTIEINLGAASPTPPKAVKGPKPEIEHMFRPAEKRPAKTVSLLFTGLTAAPLLVLLILWSKIGTNFGNFTITAVPFHLGFGSILGLFTLFWLKLDMFTTCAWLIPIGGFTFFSGHKLLSHMARKRKPEKTDK
ncbi:dolichyl-diphosphooligosaccharide--protein glycosyltransferase subunit 2 [Cylas formicarius]|uniref:dolichyl-diphosphooligosaccharide--protein glycosyltransferase subunit 2 n=1 Tax=Cylas formicarius TaxID=197179 RepID=UPI002958DF38|nr:dolichyl-diphosphooligosaccharide--protein glycosyltransferase subunit 2 [Cylas formicarius]